MSSGTQQVTSPGKDPVHADGADRELEERVATMIPDERYRNLDIADRLLLAGTVERFLADSTFRGTVRHLLRPSSFNKDDITFGSPSFPFMKLPAELRLMIAKYALVYPEGLMWHWKSEQPDKRVGTFKSIEEREDRVAYYDNPLTRLCLSRALRQEMFGVGVKDTVLYFHGDDLEEDDTRDDPELWRAVEACEFFLSRLTPGSPASVPKIHITAGSYALYPAVLVKLTMLAKRSPRISVIEYGLDLWPSSDKTAHADDFCAQLADTKYRLRQQGFPPDKRTWRVFPPDETHLHIETFKEHMSKADFEAAKDLIENGI